MSVFDKYLVNKPLHAETDSGAIPAAFYSEDFAVSLGDFQLVETLYGQEL